VVVKMVVMAMKTVLVTTFLVMLMARTVGMVVIQTRQLFLLP
jgi:hypothetical protein